MDRLIPVILFIDKTLTDIQGRLKLEPITFTLGIFKLKIRNSITRAWRTLGFATDVMSEKNVKKEIKLQDYHNILKVILRSYIECQKNPPLWSFDTDISGKKTPLRVHKLMLPTMYIMGDTQGHDNLVGKGASKEFLCRYCNVPKDQLDNPYFLGKLFKHKTICKLVAQNDSAGLRDHSIYNIQVAE